MSSKLVLLLLTYNRLEYAVTTLHSTLENIVHDGKISVHIASDGDTPEYIEILKDIAGGYPQVQGITVSNSNRAGYGANYNLATQVIHDFADYVLCLEDDWRLVKPLGIDNLIADMELSGEFGCVRLGYLSFTQPLYGEVLNIGHDGNKYLLLDPNSPEPHVFAGHPRLESVEWQRKVGPWPEGLAPGATEFAVTHLKAARHGVVWPLELVKPSGDLFAHIGSERAW